MNIGQGDIWWVESPDAKGRPYLVLVRDSAIPVLTSLLAAPLTTTIRGIPSEVAVGADDGVPQSCVASCDNSVAVPRSYFVRQVGRLAPGRWHEVCAAIRATINC